MAVLRVTTTTTWIIDADAWLRAAEESDSLAAGQAEQLRVDHEALADVATGYADATDHRPRWARDCMSAYTTITTERIT
jgi:hypothetical protein